MTKKNQSRVGGTSQRVYKNHPQPDEEQCSTRKDALLCGLDQSGNVERLDDCQPSSHTDDQADQIEGWALARLIVTTLSSIGRRVTSRTRVPNSGNSSKNKIPL